MFTIVPPPCARITGTAARHVRNIEATFTSITRRHSSSGISVKGRIASDAYRPALLTSTSSEPQCSTVSSTIRSHGGLVRDVGGEADPTRVGAGGLVRSTEVGDHDPGALGREAVGDRLADALRRAGDERDLAVELAHVVPPQRIGENAVGTRMRFCCVWISGWIDTRNAFQSSRACSAARRSSRAA